jgi:hypothetical protein
MAPFYRAPGPPAAPPGGRPGRRPAPIPHERPSAGAAARADSGLLLWVCGRPGVLRRAEDILFIEGMIPGRTPFSASLTIPVPASSGQEGSYHEKANNARQRLDFALVA